MSKNIDQVYIANPIVSNAGTDLMYFGQSPYGAGNDAAMLFSNFAAQFGAPYTAAALTKVDDTNVTLTLGGTPATALLHAASITAGWTGQLSGARGGTGVNNGINTATYAGNLNFAGAFTTSGAFAVTQTYTGATNVTFPTSGTLATTSQLVTPAALTKVDDTNVTLTLGGSPSTALVNAASITAGWSGQLSLTRGGSNASLTASNGGIVYSTASAMAILSGTATANLPLLSQSSSAPVWGSFALSLGGALTTAGALTTSGAFGATFTFTNTTSVTFPTSGTLATTTQIPTGAALTKTDDTNVTLTLGGSPSTALVNAASITAGWTGTLSGTRGGTGVNNGASTITIGGNVTYSGAFTFTGTLSNNTSVTFPTSGTLATTSQLNFATYNDVSGTTQAAAVNNGYIISNAAQTTVTIPATAAEGSIFAIQGKGAGGWIVQMNTGQVCHLGSSATSSAGTLTSTNQWDAIEIVCVTANTTFAVKSVIGNITVA